MLLIVPVMNHNLCVITKEVSIRLGAAATQLLGFHSVSQNNAALGIAENLH